MTDAKVASVEVDITEIDDLAALLRSCDAVLNTAELIESVRRVSLVLEREAALHQQVEADREQDGAREQALRLRRRRGRNGGNGHDLR